MIELTEDQQSQQLVRDYKETFGTDGGKRVLAHMKLLALYNTVVQPPIGADGHIDSYEVVRRDAQRSVIIHIETMLKKKSDEEKGIQNEPSD